MLPADHIIRNFLTSAHFKRVLSIVLAILVFTFLGVRAIRGIREVATTGVHFHPGYLLLSIGSQFIGVLLAAAIWSDILHKIGIKSAYLFDLGTFLTTAIARKIPGTVWYAVGRITIYNAKNKPKSLLILALVIESLMIALGGLINFGISLGNQILPISWLKSPFFLLFVIPLLLLVISLLSPRLINLALQYIRQHRKQSIEDFEGNITRVDTVKWIIGETIVVLLATLVGFFIIKSMNSQYTIPFTSILAAVSLAVTIGPLAMWLPGDIGLKDGFLYLAITPWTSASLAALITLSWRIWLSVMEIAMGLVAGIYLNRELQFMNITKMK